MGQAAQRPDIVWLTPRGQRDRTAEEIRSEGLQLSRAQKWDLVRICVAAVASAGFFSAPFLLSPDPGPVSTAMVVTTEMPGEQKASLQDTLDRISIVTTDVVAPVSAVLVQPVHRTVPKAPRPAFRSASQVTPAAEADAPSSLARRLGRAIAGDGRYTVRPFPTLQSNQF